MAWGWISYVSKGYVFKSERNSATRVRTCLLQSVAWCTWVWVSASQKIPLSVLARNTHKGIAREISHETGRRRGKPRSQSRTEQSRTEQGSQQERAVDRSLGKPMVRERRLLGPVEQKAGLSNVRGWVSIPGDFVGISVEYTLAIAVRITESYSKLSQTSLFVSLDRTQVRVCLFVCSLYFHTLSCVCCVLCVCKEMWNTSGRSWEEPLDNRMVMGGFGGRDSGGRSASVFSQKSQSSTPRDFQPKEEYVWQNFQRFTSVELR